MTDQLSADTNKNRYRTPADAALLTAWLRFLQYDNASIGLKRNHTNTRIPIIVLVFLGSLLAVAITYANADIKYLSDFIKDIEGVLQIILILIPLFAAGMMTHAYQFSPSMSWIAYRTGAEMIRHQIYLYRMEAGEYAGKSPEEQQRILLKNIGKAQQKIDELASTYPHLTESTAFADGGKLPELVKQRTDNPNDDGFSRMTAKDYITYRVTPQVDWYIRKTNSDYKKFRVSRRALIILTGASAAFAAFGTQWAPLVAVVTALSAAGSTYIDLKMYGRTFPIFHRTANRANSEIDVWKVNTPPPGKEQAEFASLVERIEAIFEEERNLWMQQAVHAAVTSEQALMKSLGREPDQFDDDNGDDDDGQASNTPDKQP